MQGFDWRVDLLVAAGEQKENHRSIATSSVLDRTALASVIVMPLLSKAKRRISSGVASAAMAADARQTDFCA